MSDDTQDLTPGKPSLDELLVQVVAAEEAGRPIDGESLAAKHPQFAAELREFIANRRRMQQLAAPLREAAPGGGASNGHARGTIRYFGDYELLDEIAAGGMGIVYKARQVSLNRIVAVKMILKGTLATEDDVKRFRAEAEAAASLQHPGIVAIHEVGLHEGQHYFSMDYVDGQSLASLPREKPLSARQAAEFVREAAVAVHAAHQQGTLHRDLKPSNILIDRQGRVRITDFGLAKQITGNSDLTLTGQILGTPSYMPPEQALGKRSLISVGSDVYSLGAVLYELLAGRPPFRGESPAETLRQVESLDPISPRLLSPATPGDLETICLKCLDKEPHKRYATAQLLADDLGRFLRGEPIQARRARAWERGLKWVRRHPTAGGLVLAIAVALLALVGVAVGQYYNRQLRTLNQELAKAKSSLETNNTQLQRAKTNLETTNQELATASGKLAQALDDVQAERRKTRHYLYAARMALAQRAQRENQPARVLQILRSVIPENADQEDLRDFEWNFLWRKYHGEDSRLPGHAGAVTAVAFSANDRWFASGSADHSIKLWDAATGKVIDTLSGHLSTVTAIAFSGDSQLLVSGSADKTVKIWDLPSRQLKLTLAGHQGAIASLAISEDGKLMATVAAWPDDKAIRVWDVATGEKRAELKGNMVRGLAFHPDGKRIAAASDGQIRIWSLTGNEPPIAIESSSYLNDSSYYDFRGEVVLVTHTMQLAFTPDGTRLAAGLTIHKANLLKGTVTIWDMDKRQPVGTHKLTCALTQVTFSPDGTMIAASGLDQSVRVWNAAGGNEVCTLRAEDGINSVAFSPDGSRIVAGTADRFVIVWSLPGKEVRTLHQGNRQVNCVSFGAGGRLLAGVLAKDSVVIWDSITGRISRSFPLPGQHYRIAFSPIKGWLAGVPAGGLADSANGREIAVFPTQWKSRSGPFAYDFSQDERLVAVASGDQTVGLWDIVTGQPLHSFQLHHWVSSVALNPQGTLLAAGSGFYNPGASDRGALQVWDTTSGEPVMPMQRFPLDLWSLDFSPDGKLLAAAMGEYQDARANSGRVRVWDTSTWQVVHDMQGHSGCSWAVQFSPSGQRLASVSGRSTSGIRKPATLLPGETIIWDTFTGQEVLNLPGDKGGFLGVAFSLDGRRIATGSQSGLVQVLDGTPLAAMPSYQPLPESLAARPAPGLESRETVPGVATADLPPAESQYRAGEGPVPPGPNPDVPILRSPEPGAILDNGRTDRLDDREWEFRWEEVAGATGYTLQIFPPARTAPVRIYDATQSSFRVSDAQCIEAGQRLGWKWRVKAKRADASLPFSAFRGFDVEPPDTDPPQQPPAMD